MTDTKPAIGGEHLESAIARIKAFAEKEAAAGNLLGLTYEETVALASHLDLLKAEGMVPPSIEERLQRIEEILALAFPDRIVLGDGIVRLFSGNVGKAIEIVDERNPVGTPSKVEEAIAANLKTIEVQIPEEEPAPKRIEWTKPLRTIDGRPARVSSIFELNRLVRVRIDGQVYEYGIDSGKPLDLGPTIENVPEEV
ncbi:hypothetical protein [Microvirga sp. Mcv34]|uniref:hypothetical protein n=1 Tax=Microvirga sp. Mcv34 TaxID=2926016 RepID=UPI0021C996D1|nr:hypothetical protein [Microvirga sp. Mcv34]